MRETLARRRMSLHRATISKIDFEKAGRRNSFWEASLPAAVSFTIHVAKRRPQRTIPTSAVAPPIEPENDGCPCRRSCSKRGQMGMGAGCLNPVKASVAVQALSSCHLIRPRRNGNLIAPGGPAVGHPQSVQAFPGGFRCFLFRSRMTWPGACSWGGPSSSDKRFPSLPGSSKQGGPLWDRRSD